MLIQCKDCPDAMSCSLAGHCRKPDKPVSTVAEIAMLISLVAIALLALAAIYQ